METSAEKMNTECEQSTPRKGRKTSGRKNDKNMVTPKDKQREAAADKENRGVAVPKQKERKKETLKNVSNLLPPPPSFSTKTGHTPNQKGAGISRTPQPHHVEHSYEKVLDSSPSCSIKSNSSSCSIKNNSSLEEEFRAVRSRLQQLDLEKERTDKLLEERDALLKQQEAELEIKAKTQERLQLQLKNLQKLKELKPVLSYPLEQSLRMAELAKEQEKKKKIDDPNRLKEPSPPYILWCQDQWNQMKSENQNIAFKDMRTIMGEKWKALNAEEKKPYDDKYEAEKEAYLQTTLQKKKQQKDEGTNPNRPKKPPTSSVLFSKETREMLAKKRPEISNTAINTLISVKGKELGKTGKKIWDDQATSAIVQYKTEMEEYKKKMEEQTQHQIHCNEEEMEVGIFTANITSS